MRGDVEWASRKQHFKSTCNNDCGAQNYGVWAVRGGLSGAVHPGLHVQWQDVRKACNFWSASTSSKADRCPYGKHVKHIHIHSYSTILTSQDHVAWC
jgi:hypothetical protein